MASGADLKDGSPPHKGAPGFRLGASAHQALSYLWRGSLGACALFTLESSGLTVKLRLQGRAFALGAAVFVYYLEGAVCCLDQPIRKTPDRELAIDLLRGVVLQHILMFHAAFDFNQYRMLRMCQHAVHQEVLGVPSSIADLVAFALAVTVGHTLMIMLGATWPRAAELLLTLFSACLVTTWRSWSRRLGVGLIMGTAGYAAMHQFQRPDLSFRSFLRRQLLRSLVLGLLAGTITLGSYALYDGERVVCFGPMHLLATAGMINLPFFAAPRIAMLAGSGLLALLATGRVHELQLCRPRDPDWHPFLETMSCYVLGAGLHSLQVHRLLNRPLRRNFDRSLLVWLGQRALQAYVLHQAVLYPLAAALAAASGVTVTPGGSWCEETTSFQKWLRKKMIRESQQRLAAGAGALPGRVT